MQEALDEAYKYLIENYSDQKYLWDLSVVKKWGKSEASDKQKLLISRKLRNYDVTELTKQQASLILSRLLYKGV